MSEKNANNVDQIRDLIFGSQIKEFEERFNQLNTALHTAEEQIASTLNATYTKLQKETERALEALEQKIDNLAVSTQKERAILKDLIHTTDEALHDQLNNQQEEFGTKLKIMKENTADENQKMAKEMQAMKHEIQATVEAGLSSLSNDKLSRDTMAQMLLDVAMKIQGTDMTALLVEEKKSEK